MCTTPAVILIGSCIEDLDEASKLASAISPEGVMKAMSGISEILSAVFVLDFAVALVHRYEPHFHIFDCQIVDAIACAVHVGNDCCKLRPPNCVERVQVCGSVGLTTLFPTVPMSPSQLPCQFRDVGR